MQSQMSHTFEHTHFSLTFLLFLIVTRDTPGTGFMPSFCIAFLLFFSDRLCLPRPPGPPASSAAPDVYKLAPSLETGLLVIPFDLQPQLTSLIIVQIRCVIFAVNVRLVVILDLLQQGCTRTGSTAELGGCCSMHRQLSTCAKHAHLDNIVFCLGLSHLGRHRLMAQVSVVATSSRASLQLR